MGNLLLEAQNLILAVRNNQETADLINRLADYTREDLENQLFNDNRRKAFWINIYNAYYQILRTEINLKPPVIFTNRAIRLGGESWSLDDIEHGVLRKYRYKYSLGYFPGLFVPHRIKHLAVEKIDYRIHFALNCGAVSCPPIAIYNDLDLEEQLVSVTQSFLMAETTVDEARKKVAVSRILFWFLKDFGGKRGIREILRQNLKQDFNDYKISFKSYSWTEKLHNFV